ncbi:hypothetical protein BDB01DRAFT_897149 [Pilobolus umbonatus]|nr:hypothetical protein BDB01DRAFT_897149 [Pilobolus umbonatus]
MVNSLTRCSWHTDNTDQSLNGLSRELTQPFDHAEVASEQLFLVLKGGCPWRSSAWISPGDYLQLLRGSEMAEMETLFRSFQCRSMDHHHCFRQCLMSRNRAGILADTTLIMSRSMSVYDKGEEDGVSKRYSSVSVSDVSYSKPTSSILIV